MKKETKKNDWSMAGKGRKKGPLYYILLKSCTTIKRKKKKESARDIIKWIYVPQKNFFYKEREKKVPTRTRLLELLFLSSNEENSHQHLFATMSLYSVS